MKVGDKVERTSGEHLGMVRGDVATIVELMEDGEHVLLDKYQAQMSGHSRDNLKVISRKVRSWENEISRH